MSRKAVTAKLLVIGCGLVGSTFLEMLDITPIGRKTMKHYGQMIVFDMKDKSDEPTLVKLRQKKVNLRFIQIQITPENIETELLRMIHKGDMVIDCSYNIYFKPIVCACLAIGAHYINTSVEDWPSGEEGDIDSDFLDRTLHEQHAEVIRLNPPNPKSTLVVTHGMNPGLISHFGLLGLDIVTRKVLEEAKHAKCTSSTIKLLAKSFKAKQFAQVAAILGLESMNCTENDTQVPNRPRKAGEFMNTWSPYSFYSEGVDPVQLGWGTHEQHMPMGAVISYGEPNEIYIPIRGIDMIAESHVYNKKIVGMLVSHSENDTLSQMLTLKDPKTGEIKYRPSTYYIYSPADCAWESFAEVRNNSYRMLPKQAPLRATDILSGEDAVGSLLTFKCDPVQKLVFNNITPPRAFWSGTILSIEQTREMGFIHSGPTPVQVGASLLSTIQHIHKHPRQGIVFPEHLPYDKILNDSRPYLGTIFTDFLPFPIADAQFQGIRAHLSRKDSTIQNSMFKDGACAIL